MGTDLPIFYLAAVLAAGWGAGTDLIRHKIYNKLTIPAVLAGGVFAVGRTILKRNGRESFRRVGTYLTHLLYTKQFHSYQPESQDAYFSFGACIFAGTLGAVWKMCL